MRLELTSRSSYAIRAVIAVARADGDAPVPVSRIAAEMGIPPRFLPQVMGDLVKAGLVSAQVGRTGGYRLGRPANTIGMLEIIEASEGDTRRLRCVLRGTACGLTKPCDVHAVFEAAQNALRERLAAATVADALGKGTVAVG